MRRIVAFGLVGLVLGSGLSCRPPADHSVEHQPHDRVILDAGSVDGADDATAVTTGCAPADGRCISYDVALVCEDGQRWVEHACGAGSVCLGTNCLALKTPDGQTIDVATLREPRGEGWFNAWTSIGPIVGPMSVGDASSAPDAGSEIAPRALCARDGRVDVHEKLENKKGSSSRGTTHQRFSGYLVTGHTEPIVLTTGFAGTIRMTLDGKRFFEGTSDVDPAPLRDEKRAVVDLERGVHRLEVMIEQGTSAPTWFWLRARSPAGGPARDVLFAQDSKTSCSATDLLGANILTHAVAEGLAMDVRPRWLGMGPLQTPELPYRVEAEVKKAAPRELARGTIAKTVVDSSSGTFSFVVPIESAGAQDVHVRLGDAPGADIIVPVVVRQNLHRRIVALAAKRSAIEDAAISRADKDSLLFHLGDLVEEIERSDPDTPWIKRRTEEAEDLVKALEQGKPPYEGRTGLIRRAYRSPLDGNLQPYALWVPRAYRPGGKALPLVVAAHGLGNRPEVALRVVVGKAPEGGFQGTHEARHFGGLPDFGAFVVAPGQFGNSGQRHLGEADLLRVIDDVRAHYPINGNRIAITGYSLGGTVSFVLPLHYPDVFSASAPLCGYPNLLEWSSIRTPPHKPWEDVLISKRYIVNWAENGLHVPMFMVHGGLDEPRRSEVVAKRYQALGYAFELDVQDDLDHNVWDYGYKDGDMLRRLMGRKRPEVPEHVRFVTGEWRYDRAYWVRVLGFGAQDKFVDIDARHAKRDATITVQAKNVEAFALELKQLALKKEPTIIVNGKTIAGPFNADTVYLVKQSGEFVLAEAAPSREGKKRADVSGPLDDIDRHSRIIVYGTQDVLQTEENRMVAEHFAAYDTFAARYPVKSDVEITDAEIDAKSLVLIGNSKSNRLTALFEASFPVKFEAAALVFRGKRYEGADVGVSFIHPHPRNAREYVVVHAGVGVVGTLASRHLPRFVPDFLVYDARMMTQRGGHLLDQRPVLEGGFFDMEWK